MKKIKLLNVIFVSLLFLFIYPVTAFAAPDFTVSNVSFNHSTGAYSFDYTGYTGNPIWAVSARNDANASVWNWYENNASCNSTRCSGVMVQGHGVPTCSSQLVFDIFDLSNEYLSQSLEISDIDQTCSNSAPSVGAIIISPNPVQINNSVIASLSFIDQDQTDTHTAVIDWGDGVNINQTCSLIEPNNSNPGLVTCELYSGYSTASVYPVSISLTDGEDTSFSPIAYASVYNPTQGSIFSGGQRFANPSTANISAPGNIIFGLTYKYQEGSAQSIRQFSMDFNSANIHFNATNVDSLVISGDMATLQGSGELNGEGGYDYFVTGLNGGGIRIQITDSASNIIYDTQLGDSISASPTTSVSGHIVVK